jgi:hypothetical protein
MPEAEHELDTAGRLQEKSLAGSTGNPGQYEKVVADEYQARNQTMSR